MLLGDIFKKVRSTLHAYKYYGKDNQSKQIYRPLWSHHSLQSGRLICFNWPKYLCACKVLLSFSNISPSSIVRFNYKRSNCPFVIFPIFCKKNILYNTFFVLPCNYDVPYSKKAITMFTSGPYCLFLLLPNLIFCCILNVSSRRQFCKWETTYGCRKKMSRCK